MAPTDRPDQITIMPERILYALGLGSERLGQAGRRNCLAGPAPGQAVPAYDDDPTPPVKPWSSGVAGTIA